MHKLLERQLRKHYGGALPEDSRFTGLLAAIDAAYREGDSSRLLLERSMELASVELVAQNAQLQLDLQAIKRLEIELRQAEKLRAVGQLAAGVAHEINTPIQYIGDSVQFVKDAVAGLLRLAERVMASDAHKAEVELGELRKVADELDLAFLLDEVPKALEQTSEGVRRVAGIVSAMKDFGRTDSREKTLVDVNRCLESTLLVAHNELKFVADVEVSLGSVPLLPAFPGELNQVLLNLLINAGHAVLERRGSNGVRGLIRVTSALEGRRVLIAISDDGSGIAPELHARIFEPFFTTKAIGKGTGQGLAIARSIIVEKHGGSLTFESQVGQGTRFVVSLPIEDRRSEQPNSLRQIPKEAEA